MEASAYTVPTDLPEADGTTSWGSTTVVVVTVRCGEVWGTGWTYGPAACAGIVTGLLRDVVVGRDALSVPGTWEAMVRAVRNATRAGACGYAISAVDVACWDLKARLLGLSLVDLLGRAHQHVDVYGSGGFTTYDDEQLRAQLTGWVVDQRIPRVKIKIGESWGGRESRDLERIAQARDVIGPEAALFVDANGGYRRKQALRVMQAAREAGISWLEEPVSSDDLVGLHLLRDSLTCDVAAGEYGTDIAYFRRMCGAGAVDCLQIDATRCGGYTEWVRAAAVAASFGLDVSAHCAPNLHAPVAAGTPNTRHLEWFHDHVRIENMFFDGTLDPVGGAVSPDAAKPGHGLTFDVDAARRFAVQ
ncbi:MAG: enolase C-terminal domain-like protein [Nocardioidaceae bacterium]